jgi:hypothetical protein
LRGEGQRPIFVSSKDLIKLLMRKLLALCALLLSTSAAMAQTDKTPAVTKLPGEERLSVRERAERDFLMPVRRKKMAELTKVTAMADQDATASPELDATASYTEAPDARPEEVAAVEHTSAVRHHSRARRHSRVVATTHSSKAKRTTKAAKTSAHRSTKKSATHKAKSTAKKKTTAKRHQTATKKTSTSRKRRR